MPWERCDKDGQPSTEILVVAPGMGSVEAELDCVRTVVVFGIWDKGEAELIFLPLLMVPLAHFPDPLPLRVLFSFRLSSSSCSLFILAIFFYSISMSLPAWSYLAE